MRISWLSHYTRTADERGLRTENERRAAALHSRLHALHELADELLRGVRTRRRHRAGQRELDGLSPDRLRDVGLRRAPDGSTVGLPADAWVRTIRGDSPRTPGPKDPTRR